MLNCKAFKEVVGPVLVAQLGKRRFMYGDSFTALDVVAGYILWLGLQKRPHFFDGFPTLVKYAQNMGARAAFRRAIDEE